MINYIKYLIRLLSCSSRIVRNTISKCYRLLIFGYVRITILQTKNGLKPDLTKKVCKRSRKRVFNVYLIPI
jgi:hypothetical protein